MAKARSHHARSFTYQVASRQALDLLRQLNPHLKTYKARRAELVLDDYLRLTPGNGRYTPEIAASRLEFEARLLAIKR